MNAPYAPLAPSAEQLVEQFDEDKVELERRLAVIRNELKARNGNALMLIQHEEHLFEIAFHSAMDWISDGKTLQDFFFEYHTVLSPSRFRRWVFRDPRRKDAYLTAKALGAEAMEEDLVRIADGISPDGSAVPEEASRSKLRVDARRFLMAVNNRKKYGETKFIEQNVTTNNVNIENLSTEDLKMLIMRQSGIDAETIETTGSGDAQDAADS